MKELLLVDSDCELKRYLKKFKGSSFVSVDPSQDEKISKLKFLFFSYSMFQNSPVLLKWVERWKKTEWEWLKDNISKCERDVIVTSSSEERLKTLGKVKVLLQPKPWQEEKWIEKIKSVSTSNGASIEDDAAVELWRRTGPNLDLVCSEVEKLSVISKRISFDTVAKNVPQYALSAVFDFVHLVFEKKTDSVELLKEVLKDRHVLSVVKSMENYCILLLQLLSLKKTGYSWKDIQEVSKKLGVKTPLIAEMVGFPLGKKQSKNLLECLNFKDVAHFLERIQDVEFKVKEGERGDHLLLKVVLEWLGTSKLHENDFQGRW